MTLTQHSKTNRSGMSESNAHHVHRENLNPMTYFLIKSLRLRKNTLAIIVTGFLALALLMERMCFIVTVYKTRYYGYVLILIVILFNCIFNYALKRLTKKKKQRRRLHELFNIERTPSVSWCVIGIIG